MDIERIKQKYRRNARFYDLLVRPLPLFERLRRKAVARLGLRPGETVVDLGCGTGLSFELLERGVGRQGRIIGVEITPEMLAKAREKVARHGWSNVTLIEASAEEVDLEPDSVDAVLCCLTNDIMHSRAAVKRAVRSLRPGGRFVATGVKLAAGMRGRIYFVRTGSQSGERISRTREEGPRILLFLWLGTLGTVAGVVYVVAPDRIKWASLTIPTWLRWAGAGLASAALPLFPW